MNDNNKKKEEKDEPFNNDVLDPTKDAFFSDLTDIEKDIIAEAIDLKQHALSLIKLQFYDDGIEVLRQAIGLYSQINKNEEINALRKIISDAYMQKEQAFRKTDIENEKGKRDIQKERILKEIEAPTIDERKEIENSTEDISKKVEKLMEEANQLIEIDEFDEAIDKYDEAIKLFKETNNESEIEKIYELIEKCYDYKSNFLRKTIKEEPKTEKEVKKEQEDKELEIKTKQVISLDEEANKVTDLKEQERIQRLRKIEAKKIEEENFKSQITELVDKAEKLAREYEIKKKKALKNNQLLEVEAPYHEVIEIFTKAKDMLIERGWTDQAIIYQKQINLYLKELEKDKKLRDIEIRKREKDEEYLESLKIKKPEKVDFKKLKAVEEKYKKEIEDEIFQKEITEMIDHAEKIVREYQLKIKKALKNKKQLEEQSVYPEVIEIYTKVKDMLIERGWTDQAIIYQKQIILYLKELEKDKRLREIEGQKREKDEEFLESLKIKKPEEVDIEKLKAVEEKYKKEIEDEIFQKEITEMIDHAEKIVREYQLKIKKALKNKKQLGEQSVYPEVIEIYTKVKDMLIERGWTDQAIIYQKQINLYLKELEKDKKLRVIEIRKREKDEEFLESLKIKKPEEVDIEKLKAVEEKYKKEIEDENFQKEILKMVSEADEMVRRYEREIRKGNFDEYCVYPQVISIYEQIRDMLFERGWSDESRVYINQINLFKQKLENDKRLHDIELQKIEKQKLYEESLKTEIHDESLKVDIEKLKDTEEQYKKELEEEDFENQIMLMVNEADKLARNYVSAIRKGKFEIEAPYRDIIMIYKDIQDKLFERGWNEEAVIYTKQIRLYEGKLAQDSRLREIETQKRKKDEEFLESLKIKKPEEFDIEKLKAVEEKYKKEIEDENFQKEILKMVSEADEMVRRYEREIRKGNFEEEPPYENVINIYNNIQERLIEKGWKSQAMIYYNQIKVYETKIEKDKKLREIEAQKIIKGKQIEDILKSKVEDTTTIKLQRIQELEGKKEEESLLNKPFNLIDEAERIVKNYELNLKTEVLSLESPYEKAISLYKEARTIFQKNGWDNEASRLINTIKFYKDKWERDEKLRVLERIKLEKAEVGAVTFSISEPSTKHLKREQKIIELEQKKKAEEDLSNEAFNMIDEAERIAKKYELKLKEGIFPDSPYKQIINFYRQAKKKFEEIGWEDQANNLIGPINFYKQKLEADNRLRALEARKIEKQKLELQVRQRAIDKARKREKELLKQKQEALLLKSKEEVLLETKKDEAFRLMDQAKRELNQDNFDEAIELYKQGEKIFSEINWSEGLKMIQDSILVIKRKKQEFKLREKALKKEEAEKLILEGQLEQRMAKIKDLKTLELKQKREELLKITQQKAREKEDSEKAYDLLEQGTKLLNSKKFSEAYEKYNTAREIFKQIEWYQEVSRINNDLLFKLKEEESKYERLKEHEKKKLKEEKELEHMLSEAEHQRKELKKIKAKEKRKRLAKIQVSDKLKDKIAENLERANIIIQNFKYNEGILKLKDVIKMMERIGWEREIAEINQQIFVLTNKSHVPLPVIEEFDENENMGKLKSAYEALDKAQVSLIKNWFMKAISELNEAKFNLKETKIGQKYINVVEDKIKEFKDKIEKGRKMKDISDIKGIEEAEEEITEISSDLAYKYMDKCKKEERRNNFNKAIEFATTAKEIFNKMGPEWSREKSTVEEFIKTLKNKKEAREKLFKRKREELEEKEKQLKQEEDGFKARIAKRREMRKKKIQELMKKKS